MKTKYTKEFLEPLVQDSFSVIDVIRKFKPNNKSGGLHNTISKKIKEYEIDVSHFTKNGKTPDSKGAPPNKHTKETFIENVLCEDGKSWSNASIKARLLELDLKKNICEECGQLPIHNNKKLVLQLDHINGNCFDNRLENLRFLCPNCHTQTETFGRKIRKTW